MTVLEMDKALGDYNRKDRAEAKIAETTARMRRELGRAGGIEVCLQVEERLAALVPRIRAFAEERRGLGTSSAESTAIIQMADAMALLGEWQLAALRAQIDFVLAD